MSEPSCPGCDSTDRATRGRVLNEAATVMVYCIDPWHDFHEWGDGEWHKPVHDGYITACCDCGLVHRIDFKTRDGQVQMRVMRDDKATAGERATRNITIEHPEPASSSPLPQTPEEGKG